LCYTVHGLNHKPKKDRGQLECLHFLRKSTR
jgi:hypothetical protein